MEEPRLPPPRRTRSLEMPRGINRKAILAEATAAAAASSQQEQLGLHGQNFSHFLSPGGFESLSDSAILHERLAALRAGSRLNHSEGNGGTPLHLLNASSGLPPSAPLSSIDRMPSLVSWGQTLTVDPSKGGFALRNSPGVPPLPPSPHALNSRGRQNSNPFSFGEGESKEYNHSAGLPPPPQRVGWGAQQMAGLSVGMGNYQGLAIGAGEVGWANGGQDRVPSLLARTSSAPPLGGMTMKVGDMSDLHNMYRNLSEASTPDLSPSRSPLTVQSAASSPERERRPTSMGLPRTKLSRTSSCPPLGDVLEDSELASTESDGDGSVLGEVGSSAQNGKNFLKFRNKRKRPIPLPEGFPKGRSTPPQEGQRSPTNSQMSGGEHTESKTGDEDDLEDEDNEDMSPRGEERGGMEVSFGRPSRKAEKPKADAPKDYIHVRARRGQATDSHSLAERVRREKISERMKVLQDLVPTCTKVTGKALMLDEIINYVRSLQLQVELLSRKLAAIGHEAEINNMGEPQQPPQQQQQQHQTQGGVEQGSFQQQSRGAAGGSASMQEGGGFLAGSDAMRAGSPGGGGGSGGGGGGPAGQAEMGGGALEGYGGVNALEMHLAGGGMLQDMLLGSTRGMEGLAIDHFHTADLGDLPQAMLSWEGEFGSMVDGNTQLQANMSGGTGQGIYAKPEL